VSIIEKKCRSPIKFFLTEYTTYF